jgi:hypothetical protein
VYAPPEAKGEVQHEDLLEDFNTKVGRKDIFRPS